mmetsp:Transcript_71910/g.208290  ORF Transcript_71910/g.208290 Transcript_71910/m.208290 type:complete len:298 (+) Transcript_71910:123-1016(+)
MEGGHVGHGLHDIEQPPRAHAPHFGSHPAGGRHWHPAHHRDRTTGVGPAALHRATRSAAAGADRLLQRRRRDDVGFAAAPPFRGEPPPGRRRGGSGILPGPGLVRDVLPRLRARARRAGERGSGADAGPLRVAGGRSARPRAGSGPSVGDTGVAPKDRGDGQRPRGLGRRCAGEIPGRLRPCGACGAAHRVFEPRSQQGQDLGPLVPRGPRHPLVRGHGLRGQPQRRGDVAVGRRGRRRREREGGREVRGRPGPAVDQRRGGHRERAYGVTGRRRALRRRCELTAALRRTGRPGALE